MKDLRTELKSLFTASAKKPQTINVPELKYLAVDGRGDPQNTPAFQESIAALYGTVYTLKFMLKKTNPDRDFSILPLEGLWWRPIDWNREDQHDWSWKLMIVVPGFVNLALLKRAVAEFLKKHDSPRAHDIEVFYLREGKAVQMMHVGPYCEVRPTVATLHTYAESSGMMFGGPHHEIYLSDPRRTPPEKLRTIIRYPVEQTRGTITLASTMD
jgi:hypothetical protein